MPVGADIETIVISGSRYPQLTSNNANLRNTSLDSSAISSAQRLAHVARRAARGGDVAFQRVIHHHAISIEAPAERPNGSLHAFDPATRQAVAVALIVERNHLFAKSSI